MQFSNIRDIYQRVSQALLRKLRGKWMSRTSEAKEKTAEPAPASNKKNQPAAGDMKREKRTISEIRESKKAGEKMVYMSVPDYTSAKWAEMAGVDVAVVGDSLAMVAPGHPST